MFYANCMIKFLRQIQFFKHVDLLIKIKVMILSNNFTNVSYLDINKLRDD